MSFLVSAVYPEKEIQYKQVFPRPDKNLTIGFPLEEAYRVRHDFERFEHGYTESPLRYGKPRQLLGFYEQKKPMPQTEMTWQLPRSDGAFTPFTKAWQFLYYELLEWVIGGRLEKGVKTGRYWQKINGKKVFVQDNPYARVEYTPYSMMEVWEDMVSDSVALTDQHAFDNGLADYVQGRNLSAQPMQIKRLLFGGTVLRKIGVDGQYTMVEALDPRLPPPSLQWILENKPYLIQWTTEIGCYDHQRLADGRWVVAMFGKFKPACDHFGWERVGVPYFVLGHGGWNLVKTERLMKLKTEAYTPYVP
jgi:hypothetical protein